MAGAPLAVIKWKRLDRLGVEFDKVGEDQVIERGLGALGGFAVKYLLGIRGITRTKMCSAVPKRNAVRRQPSKVLTQPLLAAQFMGFAKVLGFEGENGFPADFEGEDPGK